MILYYMKRKENYLKHFLLNETVDNPFCDRELVEDYELSLNRARK